VKLWNGEGAAEAPRAIQPTPPPAMKATSTAAAAP